MNSGSRGSQEIRDSTYEALLTLQHAIPYLPESFRNRLQNSSADSGQATLAASNSNSAGEATLKETKVKTPRENTELIYSRTGDKKSQSAKNSSVEKLKQTKREEKNLKKLNKDKSNWKKRLDEGDKRDVDKSSESFMMDEFGRDFESSLEDPFNVTSESKIDLCSGLMDLVREIDIPFIDEDGDTKIDILDKDRKHSETLGNYSGVIPDKVDTNGLSTELTLTSNSGIGASSSDNSNRLSRNSIGVLNKSPGKRGTRPSQFIDTGIYMSKDDSTETSFEDDPDYPGMRTLNDSFNRLLGDDDTDTSVSCATYYSYTQFYVNILGMSDMNFEGWKTYL